MIRPFYAKRQRWVLPQAPGTPPSGQVWLLASHAHLLVEELPDQHRAVFSNHLPGDDEARLGSAAKASGRPSRS